MTCETHLYCLPKICEVGTGGSFRVTAGVLSIAIHFVAAPCAMGSPRAAARQARYGLGTPADTNYSGLLESPCNSKYGGDPMFYPDSRQSLSTTSTNWALICERPVRQYPKHPVASLESKPSESVKESVLDQDLPPGCSPTRLANDTVVVQLLQHWRQRKLQLLQQAFWRGEIQGRSEGEDWTRQQWHVQNVARRPILQSESCQQNGHLWNEKGKRSMPGVLLESCWMLGLQCRLWAGALCLWHACSGLPMGCHLCMRNSWKLDWVHPRRYSISQKQPQGGKVPSPCLALQTPGLGPASTHLQWQIVPLCPYTLVLNIFKRVVLALPCF